MTKTITETKCEPKYETKYREECIVEYRTEKETVCTKEYETKYEKKCETGYITEFKEKCETKYVSIIIIFTKNIDCLGHFCHDHGTYSNREKYSFTLCRNVFFP